MTLLTMPSMYGKSDRTVKAINLIASLQGGALPEFGGLDGVDVLNTVGRTPPLTPS